MLQHLRRKKATLHGPKLSEEIDDRGLPPYHDEESICALTLHATHNDSAAQYVQLHTVCLFEGLTAAPQWKSALMPIQGNLRKYFVMQVRTSTGLSQNGYI